MTRRSNSFVYSGKNNSLTEKNSTRNITRLFTGEFERVPASEEDDGRDEQQSLDSGNEEPTDPDLVDESSGEIGDERPVYVGNGMNNRGRSREFVLTNSSPEHVNPGMYER